MKVNVLNKEKNFIERVQFVTRHDDSFTLFITLSDRYFTFNHASDSVGKYIVFHNDKDYDDFESAARVDLIPESEAEKIVIERGLHFDTCESTDCPFCSL